MQLGGKVSRFLFLIILIRSSETSNQDCPICTIALPYFKRCRALSLDPIDPILNVICSKKRSSYLICFIGWIYFGQICCAAVHRFDLGLDRNSGEGSIVFSKTACFPVHTQPILDSRGEEPHNDQHCCSLRCWSRT